MLHNFQQTDKFQPAFQGCLIHVYYTRSPNYDSITSNHAPICQVVVTGNSYIHLTYAGMIRSDRVIIRSSCVPTAKLSFQYSALEWDNWDPSLGLTVILVVKLFLFKIVLWSVIFWIFTNTAESFYLNSLLQVMSVKRYKIKYCDVPCPSHISF